MKTDNNTASYLNIQTIDKKLKKIDYYLSGTDKNTQFYDVCIMAKDALEILKIRETNNMASNSERIEFLKDLIQRNYDNDNWYGRNEGYEHRKLMTIAAQVELIEYGITDFKPTYNCPS